MSILPKIDLPIFSEEIPSNKQKIKMRPFVGKEEKILLMAKETGKISSIYSAIKQVVNNCILDNSIDINKLYAFDIEYLFLKLRAASISDKSIISIFDNKDNEEYQVGIDLSKVVVKFPEEFNKIINVNDKVKIEMRYLTSDQLDNEALVEETDQIIYVDLLILHSIDKIYNEENPIDARTLKKEELAEWIDELPISVKDNMKKFIEDSPTLYYKAEYKGKDKETRSLELRTLNDFFML